MGTRWATQDAAILKTTDGGATWIVQVDARPNTILAAITAVDAARAWAVGASTDRGGLILETVDGGVTWQVQPSGLASDPFWGPIGFSAVASRDGVVAWVGGGYGCGPGASCAVLARTWDGGATWTSSSQLADGSGVRSIAVVDANTTWIVSEASPVAQGAIQRNVGSGWSKVAEGPPSFRAIAATDANRAWIATASEVEPILRTTDGGATWVAPPCPPTFGLDAIAVAGSPPSVGWAVGPGGTILRSAAP